MECNTILAEMQVPAEVETVAAESLYEALKRVKDKRSRRGKRYPAAVVLTLLVLAKLVGQVKLKGIAEWVGWQAETFAQRLPLYRGRVPCANTYRYVSDHIDVAELNTVLGEYFATLPSKPVAEVQPTEQAVEASAAEPKERRHLALDGKSLRGTRRSGEASKATVHTVGLVQCHGELYVETAVCRWQRTRAQSRPVVNRAACLRRLCGQCRCLTYTAEVGTGDT